MTHRTIEWLNANKYRRFPFVDDAALALAAQDYSGSCAVTALANDVVLDFQATATSSLYVPGDFCLASIDVDAAEAGLTFNFTVGDADIAVAVPAGAAWPYSVRGTSNGVIYQAVFGEGCEALLCADAFTYLTTDAALQPTLLVEQTRHRLDSVQGITDGQGTQAVLSGVIYIEPGYNCDPVVTASKIRLTAGRGWGAGRYCEPLSDDVISCRNALLRINGQTASEDGNLNLVVLGASVGPHPTQANTVLIKTPMLFDNMKCG